MSNLERDLKNLLSDRADTAVTSPGDWQDLTVRMSRRNKRSKRLLASGLAVALLVGPMAGFAVARAVEDRDPTGRVTAAGPGDAALNGRLRAADGLSSSASGSLARLPGQKLEKLFRRTTSDGVDVRAFISRYDFSSCQGDGWCPPADCFPNGTIVGELSTEAAVGIAEGSHYAEGPALRLTGGGAFGANGEGAPVRYVIAQTGSNVKTVRVSFEGGGRDEMAPVDGVVLLAAPADAEKQEGTVEALDSDGNVVESADAKNVHYGAVISLEATREVFVDSAGNAAPGDVSTTTVVPNGGSSTSAAAPGVTFTSVGGQVTPDHCIAPPPALPKPGEQPADPAGAKAAVEQAFVTAYNGGLGNDDAKRAVVQDSDALTGVMEEIHNGSFAQQVKDATAKVTEVVFTSPTEAAVRYDINVANSSNFTGRIGKALLIDGVWKVARVTVCADISLAGGNCPTP